MSTAASTTLTSTSDLLFSRSSSGRIELRNRVVMAPMTRNRSLGNVPGEIVATYYAQRAEAGLIVTEGTSPSPNGLGYAASLASSTRSTSPVGST